MTDVIVIGTNGETGPFQAAGLTCFEPGQGCMIERVLAERVRCDILAMTRAAFDRLPAELGNALNEDLWPELAIVPAARDVRAAAEIAAKLRRSIAGRGSPRAA